MTYEFVPDAVDADEDVLTFAIENRPGWATFSPTNGRLAGRPPASAAARVYAGIRISVSDNKAVAELPPYDLEVEGDPAANTPPTISGAPEITATVGNSYSFTPDASDPDGQVLTFSIANMPSWAGFDTLTGELSGTPAGDDVGTYAGIVISVSDGAASRSLPAFDITVSAGAPPPPVNRAPDISGKPALVVTAGNAYSFRPTASDPDGQALTFSIGGKPGWATFNPSTGRLSGTPGSGAVGSHPDIVISVSDGDASASLRGVHDHRRRGQPRPDDQRYTLAERRRRPALQLPADRERRGRPAADVLDQQPAGLGELQHADRATLGHARRQPGRLVQQRADLGQRRHRGEFAAGIQHPRRRREPCPRHQRHARHERRRRPALQLPAECL